MHLMELIHSKLELFRLEQRYTRRRNKRCTFVSEAVYVDGEYIYSPASSYASKCNTGSSESDNEQADKEAREVKANKRRSMMVMGDWKKGKEERRQDKRLSRISVREIKWDASS